MSEQKEMALTEPDAQQDNGVLAPILESGDAVIELARRAEARVEAVKKIKATALKVTNNRDWVDERGKPYLQVSGAEKVARLFGISWRISEPVYEQEPDGHFRYTYKGVFSALSASIEAIGTRSSKDAFFSKAKSEDVPPEQIDKASLKKAAYTNCIGNGVTRLLGIRNLSWDEIGESGISPSTRVEYDGKNKAAETGKQTEDDKAGCYRICKELLDAAFQHPDADPHEKPEDILLACTRSPKFKGWTSFDRMSAKGAEISRKELTRIHDEFMKDLEDLPQ